MNIVLCEGKNDALFFDELLKERFPHRIYTMYHNELNKLQEMCGNKCFDHVEQTYSLIIYGDGGKSELNKVIRSNRGLRTFLDSRYIPAVNGKDLPSLEMQFIRMGDMVPLAALSWARITARKYVSAKVVLWSTMWGMLS